MARILVDCTDMHNKPWINTGIQRVVKSVVTNLASVTTDAAPIVFQKNDVYEVSQSPRYKRLYYALVFIERALVKIIETCWNHYHLYKPKYSDYPRNLHRLIWLSYKVFSLFFSISLRIIRFFRYRFNGTSGVVDYQSGDILLIIDASWNSDNRHIIEKMTNRGVKIVVMIHDLIPLTHPSFFAEQLVNDFQQWFSWVVRISDGLIGVSKHTANVISQLLPSYLADRQNYPWVDYSYNGQGLPVSESTSSQLNKKIIKKIGTSNIGFYLCVGTLEPRKNHQYLLDTFDTLWEQGSTEKLLLVGKQGWRCEDLVARIKSHPEYRKKLFWLNNLTDAELNSLYFYVDYLIIASIDEGFGLPIVEALARKTPVYAADIDVFNEFTNDGIEYFDINNPDSLAKIIQKKETIKVPVNWSWYTQKQATAMLIAKVRERISHN